MPFWYPFLDLHLATYHSNIGVRSISNRIRPTYLTANLILRYNSSWNCYDNRDCSCSSYHSRGSMGTTCAATQALAVPCVGAPCSCMPLCIGYFNPSCDHLRNCTSCKVRALGERRKLPWHFGKAESGGTWQDGDSLGRPVPRNRCFGNWRQFKCPTHSTLVGIHFGPNAQSTRQGGGSIEKIHHIKFFSLVVGLNLKFCEGKETILQELSEILL